MMVAVGVEGRRDGYADGVWRMPLLRGRHCDTCAAAPPRAGRGNGKQSRGAARLGRGPPGPDFMGGGWRELGLPGFCRGGRSDGRGDEDTGPQTAPASRWHGPGWASAASITPACAELGAELGARSTRESGFSQTGVLGPRAVSQGTSALFNGVLSPWGKGEGVYPQCHLAWALISKTARACRVREAPGGKGNPCKGLEGVSCLTAVFLPAENMAAQREWTPMVLSR